VESLATHFVKLNPEQREAVRYNGNLVVLAGPGSGKTATLVLKAAHLLSAVIPAPRGLACITYNNEAVAELRQRLEGFGIKSGGRVFLGTVHSFCLNCINRLFGHLTSKTPVKELQVVTNSKTNPMLTRVADDIWPNRPPFDLFETVTTIRSRIVCKVDYSGFADLDVDIVHAYKKSLADAGLTDFEGIIEQALKLIEKHQWVRNLLVARFQYLLVDEYQDLGGPLSRMVEKLADAGMKIFAVGDPDQSIYEFAGAEPHYLVDLSQRNDFQTIRLKFNYRSGKRLIAASQAALAPPEPRDYEPGPNNSDEGVVLFIKSESVEQHAQAIVTEVLPELVKRGFEYQDIAIFYKRWGDFVESLLAALQTEDIPFMLEKNRTYQKTRIVRWAQQLVRAGLELATGKPTEADLLELEHTYRDVMVDGGVSDPSDALADSLRLFEVMLQVNTPADFLNKVLLNIDGALRISEALTKAQDINGDLESWQDLLESTNEKGALHDFTAEDFGREGTPNGKLIITTHHSSKGRQFPAVIIPELIQEVFPAAPWDAKALRRERRLFYVAFTRAQKIVVLVYGNTYRKRNGQLKTAGWSQFAVEISKRLKDK
jgi:DNA helicase-2/ATP-dependent DNA helicase PcrA